MRISPFSYHVVPRSRPAAGCAVTEEHEIGMDCPIGCLKATITAPAFEALADAVSSQGPSAKAVTVADLLTLYRLGELADLPGIEPRRFADIERGLLIARLITRRDRRQRSRRRDTSAAAQDQGSSAAGGESRALS
jgi:hypothetical protein